MIVLIETIVKEPDYSRVPGTASSFFLWDQEKASVACDGVYVILILIGRLGLHKPPLTEYDPSHDASVCNYRHIPSSIGIIL